MRSEDTRAEKKPWVMLKDRRTLGLKFRRQVPIDRYIVDFYCHEIRVIVEIDGGVHDQPGQAEWDAIKNAAAGGSWIQDSCMLRTKMFSISPILFNMIRALYPSPGRFAASSPSGEDHD